MLRGTTHAAKEDFQGKNERSCYFMSVGKGDTTREAILRHAVGLASRVGLSGLSIGRLAQELDLSKSGLFCHFHSKEALQIQVLGYRAGRFVGERGEAGPRVPTRHPAHPGTLRPLARLVAVGPSVWGVLLRRMVTDLDGRPGPSRDLLVRLQRSWMDFLADVVRSVVREGQFRPDTDPTSSRTTCTA